MEFLKQIFDNEGIYAVVDVYNKKKFHVTKYSEFITSESRPDHLAEIPLFPCPLVVDVDIKEKSDKLKNLYDENTILDVILSYTKVLDEQLESSLPIYKVLLLEKSGPRFSETGVVKHGFHLHFTNVFLEKNDAKKIHSLAKKESEFGDLIDDVVGKPWLIYGSSKGPNEEPYMITKAFVVDDEEVEEQNYKNLFIGQKICGIKIDKRNVEKYLPLILSMRTVNQYSESSPLKLAPYENDQTDAFAVPRCAVPSQRLNLSNSKIGDMVYALSPTRADEYDSWVSVGMILASIARTRENSEAFFRGLFHVFSKKSDKYDETSCDAKWQSLLKNSRDDGLGIGTLAYMAKEDMGCSDVRDVFTNINTGKIPVNDYDIAKLVKSCTNVMYMTHKEFGCYRFDKTVWVEVIGWENVFKKHINDWADYYLKKLKEQLDLEQESIDDRQMMNFGEDEEAPNTSGETKDLKLKLKNFAKLNAKLKNYSSLNNLAKSLFDEFFDERAADLFEQQENMIAFRNCVLDVKQWRLVEGSPDHYLGTRIEHDLCEWSEVPEENKNFIQDFWCKIFPDEQVRKYSLKNIARFFTGKNTFKQFQFWTGTGNNGKSVCISLFEYVFGKFVMKIPKTMVMGVQMKQGGTFPELCRLKNARVAIVDEVTNNDFLDPGQIKGLSGNDKLFGRDLWQKSKDIKEIIPMFFPILITNETPIIKRPDDATWSRIRLVSFESKFKSDPEKFLKENPDQDADKIFKSDQRIYDKLKENAKYFLAQFIDILLSSSSFEEFNDCEDVPDRVVEGLEKFKEGQNILRQYIEENYTVDPQSLETISLGKFMKEYNCSKPKVTLNSEEIKGALENYGKAHKGVVVLGNRIRGLVRLD